MCGLDYREVGSEPPDDHLESGERRGLGVEPHFHESEDGYFIKCFHTCRSVLKNPVFWIGTTLSFPIEHYLWTKVWPFYYIAGWMGLD